jgi:YD repeat-containing protein
MKCELVRITDALGNTITFARNADGDLVQKQYAGAGTVSYAYDLNRRLTGKTLEASAVDEVSTYAYDAANQLRQRVAQMTSLSPNLNQNLTYTYDYDPAGREITYEQVGGLPVFYTWDLEGNRTSISIEQTGYWVTTEYDANHRPVRMTDQQNGDVWYFNYDAANRRTSVVYPDGSAIFTVYDAAGQVVEQRAVAATGEILFLEQNTYDQRGNIVETVTETERRTYEYNARDWLTLTSVENLLSGTFYFQELRYDPTGNLIHQELQAPGNNTLPFVEVFPSTFDGTPELTESIVITYEYDAANRLVFERGVLAKGRSYQVSYAWDGAGNMIRKTVTDYQGKTVVNTMTWTAENRLVRQTTSQGGVFDNPSFVEGDGKDQNTWAVARTGLNGAYLLYTYDHLMRHVLWEGAANSPSSKYILGPNRDELLAAYQKSGNALEKSFVYQNFRQDVLAANNLAKSDTFRRNYLPTGVAIAHDKGDVAPIRGPKNGKPLPPQAGANLPSGPLAFGWQGKARLMNASVEFNNRLVQIGRPISKDPAIEITSEIAGFWEYQNFLYLDNNSLINVDLDGLKNGKIFTCDNVRWAKAGHWTILYAKRHLPGLSPNVGVQIKQAPPGYLAMRNPLLPNTILKKTHFKGPIYDDPKKKNKIIAWHPRIYIKSSALTMDFVYWPDYSGNVYYCVE